jgi:hypothetical protein
MGLEEALEPGLDFRASCFLISQLGGDLPVGNSFSAFADQELRIGTFTFCRVLDDRVPGYFSLAMRACNFVVHGLLLSGWLMKSTFNSQTPSFILLFQKS